MSPYGKIDADVVDLLRSGRKIEAIKIFKKRTGASLRDAEDAVDKMEF